MSEPGGGATRGYYAGYPITSPAYGVTRVAGRAIREAAERHFGGRLIELGCGGKEKSRLVGDLVDRHLGIDLLDTPHAGVSADVHADVYAVPFRDDVFDCALSTAVLEHLEEPAVALREACRVLKPGGYVLCTAPLYWHLHEEPRDFYRYTKYGLRHLFEKASFEVVAIRPLGGFWLTFLTELAYYVRRRDPFPANPLGKLLTVLVNLVSRRLDVGPLRDEDFTWMYLVVARAPREEK